MKCYAIIDTNVLVSALLSREEISAAVQVLDRLLKKEIIPVYSSEILKEYQEVLQRKKLGFSKEIEEILISAIEQFGICIKPNATSEKLPDKKDLPFYEVVMDTRAESTYLVTGNIRHFPKRDYIVTARQLLEILENSI